MLIDIFVAHPQKNIQQLQIQRTEIRIDIRKL